MKQQQLAVILPVMSDVDESRTATVIATFSREMLLQFDSGEQVRARIRGKKLRPVCGDQVTAEPLVNEPEWLITSICHRENQLNRPNSRGKVEVLAANIDQLCVVAASKPMPDWFVVDRYLCAAELMNVDAIVVFNKTDLEFSEERVTAELRNYEKIGYPTVSCSAKTDPDLDALKTILAGRTSIIVGQSGVGKSTLINTMTSQAQQRTGEISSATGEGKHTTVNSSRLPLDNGGSVIDSPGVRDYAPAIESSEQVANGFREIRDASAECRFANCRHRQEPNCAVKHKVETGEISRRRYDSMQRLVVSSEQIKPGY